MNLLTIKSAFKESIPVMMGYLVLGFAFGMLLVSKGFPIYYAFIMSCFIYAGSMQFVTISLLAGQASFISSFIMTLMVNARHLVYGLSMLKKFNFLGKLKPYMIFSLTDETFSLLVKNDFKSKNEVFLISFLDQCYWIIGSLVGATIGNSVAIFNYGNVSCILFKGYNFYFRKSWFSRNNCRFNYHYNSFIKGKYFIIDFSRHNYIYDLHSSDFCIKEV